MEKLGRVVRTVFRFFLDIIETIVIASAIFIVIYLFLVQPHQINGKSMLPGFFDGEFLLTDKFSYRFNDPSRGDVIIFHAPTDARCPQEIQCDFVKRIIGLPGEVVEIKGGNVFIDGEQLPELYLASGSTTISRTGDSIRFELKTSEYFVLGDNRDHSSDSRAWGTVPAENIVGKAWVRYWPLQRLGIIAQASY